MRLRLACGRAAGWGAAMALVSSLSGCGALEDYVKVRRPGAEVVGASFRDIGLESATVVFDVAVENPYSAPLPLTAVDYALSSEGRRFLSGEAEPGGTIPAGTTRTVEIPARVTSASLYETLRSVRPGGVIPYPAELGLSADAPLLGPIRIPLVKQGEFPVPAVPEVSIARIEWDRITLNEAAGRVQLKVVNGNEFPVDMSKLAYSLSLGGAEVAHGSVGKAVSFRAAGGSGTVEIPISFSPTSFGVALFRMLSSDTAGYSLQGELAANTPFGAMSLPFEKAGTAPLTR